MASLAMHTSDQGPLHRLLTVWREAPPEFKRRLIGIYCHSDRLQRCGLGSSVTLIGEVRSAPGIGSGGIWLWTASRRRSGSHRGHRQHDPQADAGWQAAGRRRLFLLAGSLHGRFRALGVDRFLGCLCQDRIFRTCKYVGGIIGTSVSGGFLIIIAAINAIVLLGYLQDLAPGATGRHL